MSRPGWDDPKAKHNNAWENNDDDSLVDMGDLPTNVNDLGKEDDFELRFVDEDEVDIETMIDEPSLLSEGVSFEPEALHPHQFIRPKDREE